MKVSKHLILQIFLSFKLIKIESSVYIKIRYSIIYSLVKKWSSLSLKKREILSFID